jgi:hypothetical protein
MFLLLHIKSTVKGLRNKNTPTKAKLVAICSAIGDTLLHVRQVQLDKKACVENSTVDTMNLGIKVR